MVVDECSMGVGMGEGVYASRLDLATSLMLRDSAARDFWWIARLISALDQRHQNNPLIHLPPSLIPFSTFLPPHLSSLVLLIFCLSHLSFFNLFFTSFDPPPSQTLLDPSIILCSPLPLSHLPSSHPLTYPDHQLSITSHSVTSTSPPLLTVS